MTKREHILNAALAVFLEKGGTKATFGDIAKAAGISRPTLYASFDDKDALLVAVIAFASSAQIDAAQEALMKASSLDQKLAIFNEIMVMAPFRLIQQSNDVADILSGHNAIARDAILNAMDARAIFLKDMLMPYGDGMDEAAIHAIALTYTKAVSGLKNAVRTEDELQEAVDGQSAMLQIFLRQSNGDT